VIKNTKEEAGRCSDDSVSAAVSYKISRLLAKHKIKTIHVPAKENIHMLRPIRDKLGLNSQAYTLGSVNVAKSMLDRLAEPSKSDVADI
jgi:hypothetical protein